MKTMNQWICGVILGGLICVVGVAQEAASNAYRRDVRVTPLLKTQADYAGRPIAYPTEGTPEVTAVLVEIPAQSQTGWHQHPVPCFAYILEGELQLHLDDGVVKTFRAGEALAEVVDKLHNGVNVTEKSAKLVMFVMGVAGKPYAVAAAEAPVVPAGGGATNAEK
jgi:quercetin dioxygenase-like cupin family protein